MKKLWRPLVLLLVVAVMGADVYLDSLRGRDQSAAVGAASPSETELSDLPVGLAEGQRAPDFSGTTLTGESIRLSDLRGQVVLVNIFASWCAPCRVEAPHLVEVHNNVAGDDVAFIGLNLQERPQEVEAFKSDFNIDFPLVLNEDGSLTEIYQPIGLPTSWFIDEQGVIRYVHAGPMTSDLLQRVIEDVQAGRSVDPFASTG
jgi:peroxiredoxin